MKKEKVIRRLPPCSGVDVERLESWLTDMAAQGWHLKRREGGFPIWFVFQQGDPQEVRYRLEPQKGIIAEDLPETSVQELFRELGWEAMGRYGPFHIFRSLSPQARELNTDPTVHWMTMKRLHRKTLWPNLFIFLMLPLLSVYRGWEFYRFLVTFGMAATLGIAFVMTVLLVEVVVEWIQLGSIVKRMKQGQPLDHRKPWRRSAWLYRLVGVCCIVMYILWMVSLLSQCTGTLLQYDRKTQDYPGKPPFATMQDLVPGGEFVPEDFSIYNRYVPYSSDCARRNLEWREYGKITKPDGQVIEGFFTVQYHETAAPWIAEGLAKEYLRIALRSDSNREMAAPELDADYVGAYTMVGIPTLIIQEGNVVVTVSTGLERGKTEILIQWAQQFLDQLAE